MKLVIDISEEIYEARQDWVANPKRMVDEVDIAIANGTPLPKEFNNDRCDCLTKEYVPIRYEVIGYGRELNVGVSFTKQEIYTHYDYHCDSGKRKSLAIKYCPFCGRKLYKAESED